MNSNNCIKPNLRLRLGQIVVEFEWGGVGLGGDGGGGVGVGGVSGWWWCAKSFSFQTQLS